MANATAAKYARGGSRERSRRREGRRSRASARDAYSVSRMNSIAGESGARMVGEWLRAGNCGVEGDKRPGDWGRGREEREDEEGLSGTYMGGGTKDALRGLGVPPASSAAWRSEAYLSWKDLRWLISIATARRSAAMPLMEACIG